ncbi:hypothetical protein [Sphaerisporangium fuscum]|uniref:hypothetical protein n=1 Tax=Sphaerisporangium fuscum TaxID=2835868 RepID=UPI001BDDBCDE|nr:hypothetical protein [Sphaerisporangium fuscum]
MSADDDVPPPAYFVRSLPVMPTGAWIRAKAVSQGPFLAALVLALAAGTGLGLGVRPSCEPAAPERPSTGPRPPVSHAPTPGPYVVRGHRIPPDLLQHPWP